MFDVRRITLQEGAVGKKSVQSAYLFLSANLGEMAVCRNL